jgi:hypothetical protein
MTMMFLGLFYSHTHFDITSTTGVYYVLPQPKGFVNSSHQVTLTHSHGRLVLHCLLRLE